jgi:hypothetical protein
MNQDKNDKVIEWMVSKIDRMDAKLDRILEKHSILYGKLIGMAIVVSFVSSLAIEFWRSK